MSSTLGTEFRITTFGESHGKGVGVILDGCPALVPLSEEDIQPQLDRRRPGQSDLATPRNETDQVVIQSGTENGRTLGTPISMFVANRDQQPVDYDAMAAIPRPSHADFTYVKKYGVRAASGGGRSSARETIGRVAAGAVAEKFLRLTYGIEIVAWVDSVGPIRTTAVAPSTVDRAAVDANPLRCPDPAVAPEMISLIETVRDDKDSVGGTVCCVCRNVPPG